MDGLVNSREVNASRRKRRGEKSGLWPKETMIILYGPFLLSHIVKHYTIIIIRLYL